MKTHLILISILMTSLAACDGLDSNKPCDAKSKDAPGVAFGGGEVSSEPGETDAGPPGDAATDEPFTEVDTSQPDPAENLDPVEEPHVEEPQEEEPQAEEPEKEEPQVQDACEAGYPWLTLPIRVLTLQTDVANLQVEVSDEELAEWFVHVNDLWSQACIRFEVEAVVQVVPLEQGVEAYLAALESPKKGAVAKALAQVVATDDLLEPGWNVVAIKSFGVGASGVYLPDVDTLYFAKGKPQKPTHPTILAHEFGHSLSLEHFDGEDSDTNMMHSGGKGNVDESDMLFEWQIEAARDQASTGDSY